MLVGYRWYDAKARTPLFSFGHGLSYTTFAYTNLKISGSMASLTVANSGKMHGSEVVQLYLGFPAEEGEPPKQLKGFVKYHGFTTAVHGITATLRVSSPILD